MAHFLLLRYTEKSIVMKIAMPTSATRVSPRFDCAKSVLVVTIDNGGHQTAANLKPPTEMCVRGEVVAVKVPERWMPKRA